MDIISFKKKLQERASVVDKIIDMVKNPQKYKKLPRSKRTVRVSQFCGIYVSYPDEETVSIQAEGGPFIEMTPTERVNKWTLDNMFNKKGKEDLIKEVPSFVKRVERECKRWNKKREKDKKEREVTKNNRNGIAL